MTAVRAHGRPERTPASAHVTPPPKPAHPLLNLQAAAGNAAVTALLAGQPTLAAIQHEQRAEDPSEAPVRRALEEREAIDLRTAPTSVRDTLQSPGNPLEPRVRSSFERIFARNFSRVRVHTDEPAAAAAEDVQAKAFNVGHHIVFGRGQHAPGTPQGDDLIAHELTHVVQHDHAVRHEPELLRREPADDDGSERAAQRAKEKAETQQRKQERATAGKDFEQLSSKEAEEELRALERSYREAGAQQRSAARKAEDLERYRRLLTRTTGTTLEKNKRQGAFDELQRTPTSTAAPPQTKYVAGVPQLPDQELRAGRESYAQPDYSVFRRRADGSLERIHINLKSDDIAKLTPAKARARGREYLDQALRNSRHLAAGEAIVISFAQTPSAEIQAQINAEVFKTGSPVGEVRYGTTTHRRPATVPGPVAAGSSSGGNAVQPAPPPPAPTAKQPAAMTSDVSTTGKAPSTATPGPTTAPAAPAAASAPLQQSSPDKPTPSSSAQPQATASGQGVASGARAATTPAGTRPPLVGSEGQRVYVGRSGDGSAVEAQSLKGQANAKAANAIASTLQAALARLDEIGRGIQDQDARTAVNDARRELLDRLRNRPGIGALIEVQFLEPEHRFQGVFVRDADDAGAGKPTRVHNAEARPPRSSFIYVAPVRAAEISQVETTAAKAIEVKTGEEFVAAYLKSRPATTSKGALAIEIYEALRIGPRTFGYTDVTVNQTTIRITDAARGAVEGALCQLAENATRAKLERLKRGIDLQQTRLSERVGKWFGNVNLTGHELDPARAHYAAASNYLNDKRFALSSQSIEAGYAQVEEVYAETYEFDHGHRPVAPPLW